MHQKVMVTVLAVDLVKKRISLSLKDPSKPGPAPKSNGGQKPHGGKKSKSGQKPGPAPKPGSGLKLKWTELW